MSYLPVTTSVPAGAFSPGTPPCFAYDPATGRLFFCFAVNQWEQIGGSAFAGKTFSSIRPRTVGGPGGIPHRPYGWFAAKTVAPPILLAQ